MNKMIFVFDKYEFFPKQKKLLLKYSFINSTTHKKLFEFCETIEFPKIPNINTIPKIALKTALQNTHIILGISYYKLFCPNKVKINYKISNSQAEFFDIIYKKGLGEFFYTNNITPRQNQIFEGSPILETPSNINIKNRVLFGVGGGKDSIVVAEELFKHNINATPFVVITQKESPIIKNVLQKINKKPILLKRIIDPQLFSQIPNSFNGHIPITAIINSLGTLCCLLYNYNAFITANEFSANFGQLIWNGLDINHQWSKSQEFETLFQKNLTNTITPNIKCFSLLGQFNEIRIAKMFSQYKKYFDVFSSCNKNFKVNKERQNNRWCGTCPKCLFVFLILSPFLTAQELIQIFSKNLFDDISLIQDFKNLLGLGKIKPFECVGTFEEAQVAFMLAQNKFQDSIIIKELSLQIKYDEDLIKKVFCINNAPNLPDHFKLFGLLNLAIIGFGKEGHITQKYLNKFHPQIKTTILDEATNQNALQQQNNFEFAIKTPGIPKEKILIPYTTATNIFFSHQFLQTKKQIHKIKPQQIKKPFIIGITGTKGKSTTTSLIYTILKEAKFKTTLLGNIGKPMLNQILLNKNNTDFFVVELSSYQLSDINFSPNIAVCINLYLEHLNYHKTNANYFDAKYNITKNQTALDTFFYNGDFPLLTNWASQTKAKSINFNPQTKAKQKINFKTNLIGEHNQLNIKCAVLVAQHLGISNSIIKNALLKFKPLPHRLEFVDTINGITFYDDANATTPECSIMAIKSLPKTQTIFLGGLDRGYDFTELEKTIHNSQIKNVVLFPNSGNKIFKNYKNLNVLQTSSMKEAVQFAFTHTSKNKICLLSCGSPSYSLWKNFEHKAKEFRKFIYRLGGKFKIRSK